MDLEQLRSYCLAKPGVGEDFPFGPETLVFRVLGKIFALTGVDAPAPHRVNLKCDPARVPELRDAYPTAILPGYHMNKQHWNTCVMNGEVPDRLFVELIDHSYHLVAASLPPLAQAQLGLTPSVAAKPKKATNSKPIKAAAKPAKTAAKTKPAAKKKPAPKKPASTKKRAAR